MKLVVQEFLSLDGVCQGPGAPDEDPSDGFERGGWFVPFLDEEFERIAEGWITEADAFLFGSRTYANFARDWPNMTNHPAAKILNGRPKYVASKSLTSAEWNPTTILSGDLAVEVAELKKLPGRELQVHGSARLSASLLAAGLVDELRLAVAPVVVGQGRRLFPLDGPTVGLRELTRVATPGGLSVQTYEVTGTPDFGTYGAA